MLSISTYCLDWHIKKSAAFRNLLVEPLKEYASINLQAWNGESVPDETDACNGTPLIFCQFPPPPRLLENPQARLVWVPMWDTLRAYPQEWWNTFPKSMRVVAFSEVIAERAIAAGLPTLQLRYFVNPKAVDPATWNQGRVAWYWNRTGMVGPEFLEALCQSLEIRKLFFMSKMDPVISWKTSYSLPKPYTLGSRIGNTLVEEFPDLLPVGDYLKKIDQTNIYIAPRVSEGVGMAFLEALARGCAVFAFDAPTMNEYIHHRIDGYLMPRQYVQGRTLSERLLHKIKRLLLKSPSVERPRPHSDREMTEYQNWSEISKLKVETLGQTARQSHQIGYAEWQKQIPEYARFVLDWN